jgi:parvulin-like peptidyl-prolyl isomerase
MIKRLLLLTLLTGVFSYGRMLDAIAIIVEGQPVTTREIDSVRHKLNVSRQKAIDLLIQDRLQKAAMKDIVVTDEQVDEEIKHIAERNRLSVARLQEILKSQGTSWSAYRKSVKNMIKQRIFFRDKVAQTLPQPTENELKRYYETHKDEFVAPATIRVVEYSAPNEKTLKNYLKNKKGNVTVRKKTLKSAELSPALLDMLLRTPDGDTTAPLNAGGAYVAYKVLSKNGRMNLPFSSAREAVASRWMMQQRERALKDYFKKMRTEANIRYLRK